MNASTTTPELLLPAGGFDSAIAAIEGGADALYLGFGEFSARRQARNFDRLEYRRLHRLAREKGVRLYAALNTVILEDEFDGVAALMAFLGRFPPDAVLVQDWGLAALIRERHPGIAIHASTQAAVQGSSAVRVARELGASRVVLPRETSLAEMARLHEEEPGMEYEAFVHGALCYSFSGLCLASGLVLGRSGNRGECAQLCRSYYDAEGGGLSGRRGYWFSCRDLELGGRVAELAAVGIRSLKVEGRMKSPEYCYAVARLYRGLIDALNGEGPDESELEARRVAARTAFSRSPTEAWLFERGGASLIDSAYPGHRGVPAGRIAQVAASRLVLDLESDIGLRDGLLGFERGDQARPLRFPALGLRDPLSNREVFYAKSGTRLEIEIQEVEGRRPEFNVGDVLYRISARELDLRKPSPEEYEPEKEELRLSLRVGAEGIGAELELPSFTGKPSPSGGADMASIPAGRPIPLDEAKSAAGFERGIALFSESGEADFRLVPGIDGEAIVGLPSGPSGGPRSCRLARLFVPPSVMKKEKNRIYERASELVAGAEIAYALKSAALCGAAARELAGSPPRPEAPPRSALVFAREGLPSGMPFATRKDFIGGSALPAWGGRSWLPLAPLVSEASEYAALVGDRVRKELEAGTSLVVGLGALHHFAIARGLLAANPGAGKRLVFFLDFNLYLANGLAYARLAALLPRVEFAYRYLETSEGSLGEAESFLAPIGPGFEPPLFQSLGCLLKQHVLAGACPETCARSWSTALGDRDRRYRAVVEDCVTMLFRAGST